MDGKHQSCWKKGLVSKETVVSRRWEAKLENLLLKTWWCDHKID